MALEKIKFYITQTTEHEIVLALDDESEQYDKLVYQEDPDYAGEYTNVDTIKESKFEIADMEWPDGQIILDTTTKQV